MVCRWKRQLNRTADRIKFGREPGKKLKIIYYFISLPTAFTPILYSDTLRFDVSVINCAAAS